MKVSYIPKELLHIILEYDGRIKYTNGKYVNIIHTRDERYNIIQPIISKKTAIIENTQLNNSGFYFEIGFDICNKIGLCYDFNFSYKNKFDICYYDMRNGWKLIRTNIC
jgi:hypothetical protein